MDHLLAGKKDTPNTEVAAALGAMDIRMREDKRPEVTTGIIEQVVFFFEEASPCGLFHTGEVIARWDDRDWQAALPRHPVSYLRIFFHNRNRLRDHFEERVPLAAVYRHGKIELVRNVPGAGLWTEPMPKAPDGIGTVRTDKLDLACALMACGVPLWAPRPWFRSGATVVFEFHGASPCGMFRAAELCLAWERDEWYLQHREHPFAYLWCAARNHEFLTRLVKKQAPMVVMMHEGLPAMISANACDKVQRSFFKEVRG